MITQDNQPPKSGPIYDVYLISDALPTARQRWVKVGIAFLNRDTSINVVLDALPLNGRLQLRERKSQSDKEA